MQTRVTLINNYRMTKSRLRKMVRMKVCTLLHSMRTCSDAGFTVIITCDLGRIIDNVKTIATVLPTRSAHSLTLLVGTQAHPRRRPPCRLLPRGQWSFLFQWLLCIHPLSLRPSLIHVTLAQCLIFPTTTATIFMCHGYRRVTAVQKPCRTRSVSLVRILSFRP